MRGHSPGSYFTQEAVNGFNTRYTGLLASLHSLALEMECKHFPAKSHRELVHKSTAISSAVRILIDGKTPPPLTGKHKPRGVIDPDELSALDEEKS